ncbi:MAG: hypothetical protein QXR06_04360 [Candidatus Bathyarchaeia archaeon]
MKGKTLLHLFWILLPIIIRFALISYPYIVDVKITEASVIANGNVLHLKGTITVDPAKIPDKDKPWYNSPGFLAWWKEPENVNKVIAQESKFWSKFIRVIGIIELKRETVYVNGKEFHKFEFEVKVRVTIGK